MGIPIEHDEHLFFMNPHDREIAAVERLLVGEYGMEGLMSGIAPLLGIHWYGFALAVHTDFKDIIPGYATSGDIDLALIPCQLVDNRYIDGIGMLEYSVEDMILIEVKTAVVGIDGHVRSSKARGSRLASLKGQLKKYSKLGFKRCVLLYIIISEPRNFVDEQGNVATGLNAWSAASGVIHEPSKEETRVLLAELGEPTTHTDQSLIVLEFGTIPGYHEGSASSHGIYGPYAMQKRGGDVDATLFDRYVAKLKTILPKQWGEPGTYHLPKLPVVRTCPRCKAFTIRYYQGVECIDCVLKHTS